MNINDNEKISEILDKNDENDLRTIKIVITNDIYRKIKSFGVLLGIDDKEPILLGHSIAKLYELSKDKIYTNFV